MIGHEQIPHRPYIDTEDRSTLESWVRAGKTERRLAERARMVLAAANGQGTIAIARAQRRRPATVSKWRVRFSQAGLTGLQDAPRPGAAPRYDEDTRRRVLDQLDQPPPAGHGSWTGGLVANALGDVSKHQVWRVLRTQGIHLQRRRSWCISTDPQFAPRRPISLPCTWTRRNTRSSLRWMKSRIFKPWSERKAT